MNITLNQSDFQCLQDQLLDLKTKNYELAEKNRRGQADFEAAKAKICSLQLKLEEQERDFQVNTTTLRRELEAVSSSQQEAAEAAEASKGEYEQYETKYKELLHQAQEIQNRYKMCTDENEQLRQDNEHQQKSLLELEPAIEHCKELESQIDEVKQERDKLQQQVKDLSLKLDQQVEEVKIQEKKGLQIVKDLKRQLALEKKKNDTLQKRLESLLSSNGSNGSWNLVPANVGESNLSICSIELSNDERETTKNTSTSAATTGDTKSEQSDNNSMNNSPQVSDQNTMVDASQNTSIKPDMPLSEQAALLERLTQLQHDKWTLEEKLSYLQQANVVLSEELANKSDIIKHYFVNQALKTKTNHKQQKQPPTEELPPFVIATSGARRISFPNNINQLLGDNSGLKRVVDFVKERSHQVASPESDAVTREATKKMQLMLEETLIKCLKLQENLDYVTSELNKFKD